MFLKQILSAALFAGLVAGCASAPPKSAMRIDASSAAAAEASYRAMMDARSQSEQQKLAIAVLMLNMEGVKSAYDVVGNSALQSPGIARIREKVGGMTAEEIIQLASKNPSVRVEVSGQ